MNDQIERMDYIESVTLTTNDSDNAQVRFTCQCTSGSQISTTEPCFVGHFKINGPYDGYDKWGDAISGAVEPASSNLTSTVATVKFYKHHISTANSFGIIFSGHTATDSKDRTTQPFEIYFSSRIKKCHLKT